MSESMLFTLWGIGGYILGSIPFGLVLCYLAGYGDIRKIGSGNIGATNVLRTGNKWLALLTVILDASKAGLIAWLALKFVAATPFVIKCISTNLNIAAGLFAGSMAIIGHNFPIWLKFKGGKGVASAFGFLLVTKPLIALSVFAIWLATAFITRYSSLSAIVAAFSLPVITYFYAEPVYVVCYSALVVLVLIRHHANFVRLFKGQESKISFKKKA
ncbi:MAG: glycerol-3-phosphate 1-O-acyltransferase PlsY [Alphaproteobacteria bacterium]|nr:glycerol-3-phosphate 1-O-acyltransferase PlsY [Alphaproteobacteria bacterium]